MKQVVRRVRRAWQLARLQLWTARAMSDKPPFFWFRYNREVPRHLTNDNSSEPVDGMGFLRWQLVLFRRFYIGYVPKPGYVFVWKRDGWRLDLRRERPIWRLTSREMLIQEAVSASKSTTTQP